jgi:hypothetical protein
MSTFCSAAALAAPETFEDTRSGEQAEPSRLVLEGRGAPACYVGWERPTTIIADGPYGTRRRV